ncbi:MAG TPA: MBL fold metallo-hydrolase [Roseiflexaceae bacterium]|nr:MBL fold metallo-hydrolase [Roseiflexaceae bacterium]
MTIAFQVLGAPGQDNALLVRVQTGQSTHRLLLDCGAGCLDALAVAEIQAVDHLLFSHLHMDHVAGFDDFFRHTFNRLERPNMVWGPPETARIIHHRLRGFMWNLAERLQATWRLHDIHPAHVALWRAEASEAFEWLHDDGVRPCAGAAIAHPDYTVQALRLRHGTLSLGYLVREAPRVNVDPARLAALGLRPGPWLQFVKYGRPGEPAHVVVDGAVYELAALRATLLSETPGGSLAYLTDFTLDDGELEELAAALRGCDTLVCESQYRAVDEELARRNYHLTAVRAAELAARAGAGRLVLFHLSRRYTRAEWSLLLEEARAIFPRAELPQEWDLGGARG